MLYRDSNSSFLHVEPHLPHVLIEDGDMTPEEYDEHLKGRSDYIKATKKDCSNEKTVSETVNEGIYKTDTKTDEVDCTRTENIKTISATLGRVCGAFSI